MLRFQGLLIFVFLAGVLPAHGGIEIRATALASYSALVESTYGLQNDELIQLEELELPEEELLVVLELAKLAKLPHSNIQALKSGDRSWMEIISFLNLSPAFLPPSGPLYSDGPLSDEEIIDLAHSWFILRHFDCLPAEALTLRNATVQEVFPGFGPASRLADKEDLQDGRDTSARKEHQAILRESESLEEKGVVQVQSTAPRMAEPQQHQSSSGREVQQIESRRVEEHFVESSEKVEYREESFSEASLSVEYRESLQDYYAVSDAQWNGVPMEYVQQEELPLVLWIATEARVEPRQVVEYRRQTQSWIDVSLHFGLGADLYFIPDVQARGTVFESAFNRYESHRREEWHSLRMSDRELIELANLQFISGHCACPPSELISEYSQSKSFLKVHHKHKSKGKQKGKYKVKYTLVDPVTGAETKVEVKVDSKQEKSHGKGKEHGKGKKHDKGKKPKKGKKDD